MYFFRKLWHQEIYQGKYKHKNYFEGWYYKMVDSVKKQVLVIIPGVSFGKNPDESHAFIQVYDVIANVSEYFRFDISSFYFNSERFEVTIGENRFSREKIRLNLRNDLYSINGNLSFSDVVPFPNNLLSPGVMGPFSFLPFLECYHAIVNIQHKLNGSFTINGQSISFDHGYGYIEKDWGRSFPEAWFWLQANHFENPNVTLMFSIGKIPLWKYSFIGFTAFIRSGEKYIRFATYTGASIKQMKYEDNRFSVVLEDKKYSLRIKAQNTAGKVLKAPKNGLMKRDMVETVTANTDIILLKKSGQHTSKYQEDEILFSGHGSNAGFEISGDISQLLKFNE